MGSSDYVPNKIIMTKTDYDSISVNSNNTHHSRSLSGGSRSKQFSNSKRKLKPIVKEYQIDDVEMAHATIDILLDDGKYSINR